MAFNLKKVLKALLLSSSQPLTIKDLQEAFGRFHREARYPAVEVALAGRTNDGAGEPGPAPAAASSAETPTESDPSSLKQESGVAGEVQASPDHPAPRLLTSAATLDPTLTSESAPTGAAEIAAGSAEAGLEVVEEPVELQNQDPELYSDVPALVTAAQIRETMDVIAAELRAADEGLLLIEGSAGYRLVTHPRFARWVRILRQEPPPVKLSQSSIETLAVVAYRQPVTRTEIETIRGVSAEAGINKLLERDLIQVVGRAETPGRPIQYGTTDQFLEFVGIKSLDELPASDVLSSRQIDEWLRSSATSHTPTDLDMGLPDEQLPLEGPPAPAGADIEAPAEPPAAPPAAS
jgi:segregation and condensation protein B